jgi:hypothetical protein
VLLDNLGYFYLEIGNYDKALEKFTECLNLENNKDLIDAYIGISLAYYNKNDRQNTRKYFKLAKQIKPILNKGTAGLLELEKEGYIFSDKIKETFSKIVMNDIKAMNLFGKVKSIDEISYKAQVRDGKIIKGERENFTYEYVTHILFDDLGNLIQEFRYDSDSNLIGKSLYKYDGNGLRTELKLYDLNAGINESWTYLYDDKGNRIAERSFLESFELFYDKDGNIIGKIHFKSVPDVWITYKYDDKMYLVEKDSIYFDYIDPEVKDKTIFTFKYDAVGNQIEKNQNEQDALGNINTKFIYRYDVNGNIIEINSNSYFDFAKRTFKYDSSGNITEQNYYNKDGSLNLTLTHKYDYIFDNQKNWIKKIIYTNKIPANIVDRDIKYF